MNSKTNREYQLQRIPAGNIGRGTQKYRHPFWLPAPNYYILTLAVVIALFFLMWGFLQESGEESPWIPAGICAGLILGGAVFLREIILRKARERFFLAQRRLDYNLKNVPHFRQNVSSSNKLTVEKNSDIIRGIRQKSEAAKVLGKFASGHREVFEVCNEYLQINETELENVRIGSPRLAALRRGREVVKNLHRYHLLSWAEIESRALTQEAKSRPAFSDKLENAQRALSVLDSALQYYPNEIQLTESEEAVKEFIATIKVSHLVEQAEKSEFKGNYKQAINHYKDALFFLARENARGITRDAIAEKINQEIERLREMAEKKKHEIIIKRAKRKKIND